MEIIYEQGEELCERRRNRHNFCSCEKEAWRNSGLHEIRTLKENIFELDTAATVHNSST